MEPVDYVDTFIAVADDCPVAKGTPPPVKADNPSVAARTYELLVGAPYRHTSGDVIFTVYADRRGVPDGDHERARAEFYAKPQPCLRSSDLGKRYGWGIHADGQGRIALYGVETPEYRELVSSDELTVRKAMRNTGGRR